MNQATSLQTGPIVLATGGTGGHVFPAEALSTTLAERGIPQVLMTDDRGSSYSGALGDLPCHVVSAATPAGKSPLKLIGVGIKIARGILQARHLLREIRARAVVGFGGYPALPTVLAAQSIGLPTILHEQNAILGRANRVLARNATAIATSFPRTQSLSNSIKAPMTLVGNPVRLAVRDVRDVPYHPFNGVDDVRLLIMGGSQGARILSEILPKALSDMGSEWRRRLVVTQQCRAEDLPAVKAVYDAAHIRADLKTFIEDVPSLMAQCHLSITRAGASTVSELACVGRPSLLVPYPHATDDHQAANAQALVDAGGAIMMRDQSFRVGQVQDTVQTLLADQGKLADMAAAAHNFGRPDAALALADHVLNTLQNTSQPALKGVAA